jgi:hypothetical protein
MAGSSCGVATLAATCNRIMATSSKKRWGRLKTRWREQQTEAALLDAAMEENLARPGFGGSP